MSKAPKLRFKEFSGDWKSRKFKDIIKETRLGGNYANTESKTNYPLIKMGNIARGKIDLNKIEYIAEGEKLDNNDILKHGDLLFNTRNTLDLVGKVSVWKNELDLAFYNSNLMKLTFDEKFICNNYFMNYLFNTRTVLSRLKAIATGTTSVAAIYTRDLENIRLDYPCLEEQEKIASFFSLIDDKISLQGEKVEALKDYKRGMMQKIFSRELRFKDDEGRDYPDWEEKKLGEITNLTDGVHFTPEYVESGVPFWSVETIVSNSKPKYITEEAHKDAIRRCYPKKGDILLTRIGTLAVPKLVDWDDEFSIYVSVALIKSSDKYNSKFAKYYFESEEYQKDFLSKSLLTATPKKINMEDLKQTKIKLPVLEEQEKIGMLLSSIEQKIVNEEEKLYSLNEYKKGLLQQMFV